MKVFNREQFHLPRDANFPLGELFKAIDEELDHNRFVVVSLSVNGGWHMYLVFDKGDDGNYEAVTKYGKDSFYIKYVKQYITKDEGCDILTYSVIDD